MTEPNEIKQTTGEVLFITPGAKAGIEKTERAIHGMRAAAVLFALAIVIALSLTIAYVIHVGSQLTGFARTNCRSLALLEAAVGPEAARTSSEVTAGAVGNIIVAVNNHTDAVHGLTPSGKLVPLRPQQPLSIDYSKCR